MKKSFLDLRKVRELIKLKKYDEAEKILQELTTQQPDDEYVCGALFDVYLKKGVFDKAQNIIDKILQKDPGNFFFLSRKGDLLVAKKKEQRSAQDF